MNQVIVFDVWSSFGYFRRLYTTTTATTYPFIPRSSVEGIVAAIVGLDSEEFPERLESARITVSILNKVRKLPISLTYTHSDFWQNVYRYLRCGGSLSYVRAPRKAEFLCEPRYRIYLSSDDEDFMKSLKTNLARKETVFTPYLGSSNMLANFEPIALNASYDDIEVPETERLPVATIVPFIDKMPRIFVQESVKCAVEQNIPIHLTAKRELTGSYSAIYSPDGRKEILVSGTTVQRVKIGQKETYVLFVPTLGPA